MAIESKNHRPSPVKKSTVSNGTRRDAQPAQLPKFDTYEAERDYWINEKKKLDAELSAYSKAAFTAEQIRIRDSVGTRNGNERSLNTWLRRKSQMEQERLEFVQKKLEIENELSRLKPLVKAEKAREDMAQKEEYKAGRLERDAVFIEMLAELKSIKKLLSEQLTLPSQPRD